MSLEFVNQLAALKARIAALEHRVTLLEPTECAPVHDDLQIRVPVPGTEASFTVHSIEMPRRGRPPKVPPG